MYITENQSIGESVLFMLSARNSLSEMVEDSGHENEDIMVNFLMNEATDYEIMSLLVTGVLPDQQYDQVTEAYLFSMLKEQVLRQSETITEMLGEKTFNDFLTKVDSVYPTISTAGPMLEFFSAQIPEISGAMLLAERPRMGDVTAKKMADIPKPPAGPGDGSVAKPDLGDQTTYGGGPSGASSAKAIAQNKAKVADPNAHQPPGAEPSQLMRHAKDAIGDIKAGINSAADAVSAFAKTTPGMVVGGAALAALLAYGAAKTYKRFFSKAAGACRGMSGGVKSDCMNKYRGRAVMAQAADLQRGMASCAKAKNPASCKSAVGGKIERLKAKARKISG